MQDNPNHCAIPGKSDNLFHCQIGGGSSQGLPSHLQEDSEHLSQVSEVPQGDFSLS